MKLGVVGNAALLVFDSITIVCTVDELVFELLCKIMHTMANRLPVLCAPTNRCHSVVCSFLRYSFDCYKLEKHCFHCYADAHQRQVIWLRRPSYKIVVYSWKNISHFISPLTLLEMNRCRWQSTYCKTVQLTLREKSLKKEALSFLITTIVYLYCLSTELPCMLKNASVRSFNFFQTFILFFKNLLSLFVDTWTIKTIIILDLKQI